MGRTVQSYIVQMSECPVSLYPMIQKMTYRCVFSALYRMYVDEPVGFRNKNNMIMVWVSLLKCGLYSLKLHLLVIVIMATVNITIPIKKNLSLFTVRNKKVSCGEVHFLPSKIISSHFTLTSSELSLLQVSCFLV